MPTHDRLIVSTHSYLLTVDGFPGDDPAVAVRDEGHFHGVDLVDGVTYFTKRWLVESVEGIFNKPIYSESWVFADGDLVEGGLNGVHDLERGEAGLWVCDTGSNRVVLFPHGLDFIFSGTATNINHPNTVRALGGGEAMVLLHNKGRKPSEVVGLLATEEGIRQTFRQSLDYEECHDIVVEDGDVVYNGSSKGLLVRQPLLGPGDSEVICDVGGYTKGLVPYEGGFILGRSPKAERRDRHGTEGELVFVKDGEIQQVLDLSDFIEDGAAGNVNHILQITGE